MNDFITDVAGGVNQTLSFFGRKIFRSWVAAVAYWRWNYAQSKWLNRAA